MAERSAFVTGHPIAHSRSPLIHNSWLEAHDITDGAYRAIDTDPQEIFALLDKVRAGIFVGGNVTIPHKETVFEAVDRRDPAAEAIGAVNTLWREGDVLVGGNTDAYGFAANLDAEAPGWEEGGTALVLGAGGAARAVLHALLARGFDRVFLANRTRARADDLAERFGPRIQAIDWREVESTMRNAALLVNTTALGMKGKDPLDLSLDPLPDGATVTDIVYVPLETPLLARARARKLRTVDGLGMLLHQAVPGFERWFGVRPEVTPALRRRIVADLAPAAPS